ncbi:transcription factor bHLH18-like [Miscanthus floridulus]|uniref:transcription factor bHLH18-like n=1 Tax=Miscanthus floridulus TaxID=154761 RepID=UPI00345864E2
MDELNKWQSHPDYSEEELAYMYSQQEEDHAGMQQQHHFAERQPEQLQYYTPPTMAPPRSPSPFLPHHYHHSSSFPGFGVPALPRPLPLFGPVKNEPGQPSSSSSNRILSFGGQPPSTLDFSSGGDWPEAGVEAVQQMPPERRSRTHWNTQEHVIAERKRREKMQQQFVALATIVPDLTKTDKISLLGSIIEYVKQLEEKVKTLEGQRERRTSEATVFESKYRISNDSNASCSSGSAFAAGGFSPTVEASIHGDTVLLKICCLERRGVLVMIISELENQGLSIINTSVLPFTDSCLNITITAKIGAGFLSTVELITNLTATLRGFSS